MVSQDQPEQQKPKRRVVPPTKRVYHEPRFKRKTIDAAARAELRKILHFSVYGGIIGAIGGAFIGIGALPGFLIGFLFVFGSVKLLTTGAGRLARTIYYPSANSTPAKREYSYPQSLAARGEFEEAITAYEVCVAEHAEDSEPYLRIARLYRDELQRYDEAVAWFKRARVDAQIDAGQELLASQEIIEIYIHKLCTPQKAIPELARLCEKFPGTPTAESARRELQELREMLLREKKELEPPTAPLLEKLGDPPVLNARNDAREEAEAQAIRDALRETGDDGSRAARRLGMSLEKLARRMRELGIVADNPHA